MTPSRRLVATALLAAAAVGLGAAQSTAESLPVPATGPVIVDGHGYGHGIGLSQWGAYGAATKGLTHDQILAFYYPGTSSGRLSSTKLRVALTTTPSSSLTAMVSSGLGLVRADGSTVALGSSTPAGPVSRWRLLPDGGGLTLQWYSGGAWHTSGAYTRVAATLGFAGANGQTRVLRTSDTARAYPGQVLAVPQSSSIRPVNVTTFESYLRGVVPREMPASWPAAALRSQTIAARSYAAFETSSGSTEVCDTTRCQVYEGLADYALDGTLRSTNTDSRTDAAIAATDRVVRTFAGAPAFTQFSASNGGWSVAGSRPYLVAKADPYDGAVSNTAHLWRVTSSTVASRLQSAHPSIGTLRSMEVTRDGRGEWGGRVTSVRLVGSSATQVVSGSSVRDTLGLRSTWFSIRNADFLRRDVDSDGAPNVFTLRTDGSLARQDLSGTALVGSVVIGSGWSAMTGVAGAGDLDADGRGDLVARSADGAWWCYPVRSSGVLNVRAPLSSIAATTTGLAGVGDVTGDSRADLVGIERSTGILWLYPGADGCALSARVSLGQGWGSMDTVVGAADTTADGRADLWARETSTGVLWTYRLDGAGHFLWPRVRVGAAWGPIRDLVPVGDATGDGSADLLVRDAAGAAWLYPGSGVGHFATRRAVSGLGSPVFVR